MGWFPIKANLQMGKLQLLLVCFISLIGILTTVTSVSALSKFFGDKGKNPYVIHHNELHMSLINGSYLESVKNDYESLISEVSNTAFLKKKASESDNALAPCALLANAILSTQIFYLQWRIVNEKQFPAPLKGSNILGMYDDVIAAGKFFEQPAAIKADMLARMHIYWSGGYDIGLNGFIHNLTQQQCLDHLLITDPASLAELLHAPSTISTPYVTMHYAPVAIYGSTYTRQELEKYLDELKSLETLELLSEAEGNPVLPCSLLKGYMSAANINNLWETIRAGELFVPLTDMPLIGEYRELLKDGSIPTADAAVAAKIAATYFAKRIIIYDDKINKLMSQLTQHICLNEFINPLNIYKKGIVEAIDWYREAAEQGLASAQFHLGFMYEYGKGVEQNITQAIQWYREAAEQGYANAQIHLGLMYAKGQGIKQDHEEAAHWYRKAAEQGYANAQTNLGFMYEYGRGVKKDYAQAVNWYRKAAEQGHAEAQFNLGIMYAVGHGVKQDKIIAKKWYKKACEGGYKEACSLI